MYIIYEVTKPELPIRKEKQTNAAMFCSGFLNDSSSFIEVVFKVE